MAIPETPAGFRVDFTSGSVGAVFSPSAGATGYNLKRATSSGGPYSTVLTGAGPWTIGSTVTGQDTTVVNGTPYFYTISATNGDGESADSVIRPVTPLDVSNDAEFISQSVPAAMIAGETYSVSFTFRNRGTSTLTEDNLIRLWFVNPDNNQIWGRARVLIVGTVAPGGEYTFTFDVVAPAAGTHDLQVRLLQEAQGDFGDASDNVAVVTVTLPVPTLSASSGLADNAPVVTLAGE